MTTFTVEWTIEIDAATPEEAARAAYQRILAKAHGVSFDVYADPRDVIEGGFCHHAIDMTPSGPSRLDAEASL